MKEDEKKKNEKRKTPVGRDRFAGIKKKKNEKTTHARTLNAL